MSAPVKRRVSVDGGPAGAHYEVLVVGAAGQESSLRILLSGGSPSSLTLRSSPADRGSVSLATQDASVAVSDLSITTDSAALTTGPLMLAAQRATIAAWDWLKVFAGSLAEVMGDVLRLAFNEVLIAAVRNLVLEGATITLRAKGPLVLQGGSVVIEGATVEVAGRSGRPVALLGSTIEGIDSQGGKVTGTITGLCAERTTAE